MGVQQTRPNFSGKWRLLPDPASAPAPPVPDAPPDLTITQTAQTLHIEQPGARGGTAVTMTYRLDGAEMRQTINRAEVTTTASWDGEALVTTVTGPSANWKDVWTLAGGRLTIATTTPGRTLSFARVYTKIQDPR